MYNVNWNDKINNWLPALMRRARQRAWIRSLIAPVVWLHGVFVAYRTRTRRHLLSTGQVCYLERYLNDYFNKTSIYIITHSRTHHYVGRVADGDALMVGLVADGTPPFVGLKSDYTLENDFTVYVLNEVGKPTEAQVRAEVDKYKLAGKKYNVFYYTPF